MTTATDTIRAGFIRAICEEPHEDFHRLIFSDWLEDQGEIEWAEFIRISCDISSSIPPEALVQLLSGGIQDHLDTIPKESWSRWHELVELLYRSELLLTQPAVVVATTVTAPGFTYRELPWISRGFVEMIRTTCLAWKENGPYLVSRYPFARIELSDLRISGGSGLKAYSAHPASGPPFPWMDKRPAGWSADTAAEVLLAVHTAALTWARKDAGLPELKPRETVKIDMPSL